MQKLPPGAHFVDFLSDSDLFCAICFTHEFFGCNLIASEPQKSGEEMPPVEAERTQTFISVSHVTFSMQIGAFWVCLGIYNNKKRGEDKGY